MGEIRKKYTPCAAANYLKNIPHELLGTWTEFQYRKQYQIVCYRVQQSNVLELLQQF